MTGVIRLFGTPLSSITKQTGLRMAHSRSFSALATRLAMVSMATTSSVGRAMHSKKRWMLPMAASVLPAAASSLRRLPPLTSARSKRLSKRMWMDVSDYLNVEI